MSANPHNSRLKLTNLGSTDLGLTELGLTELGRTSNEPTTGFARAPAAEQAAINYAVGLIRSYTNASIQYAGAGSSDIQIAQSSAANPTSYAYYPFNTANGEGGDVWFGTQYNYSAAALGNYYFATAIHELGHALGLKHGQDFRDFDKAVILPVE